MSQTVAPTESRSLLRRTGGFWLVTGLALVVAAISQAIGPVTVHLWRSQIGLLPIIYAVVLGAVVSMQRIRPLPIPAQRTAAGLVAPVIAVFMARLGLLIGPEMKNLGASSAALLLQEVGHVFGSVLFCLPIAVVLLGLGRAGIGATYSIDREPMLGVIAERFGGEAPEYKGALGTYVVGTVFGAIIAAVLASVLGSLGVFSPDALSIGSAVGSTSMMLGAVGALTAMFPKQSDHLFALSAAASAVTGITGTYAAAFLALPLTRRLYPFWVRVAARLGRTGTAVEPLPPMRRGTGLAGAATDTARPSLRSTAATLGVFGVVMLVIQVIATRALHPATLGGMVLLLVLAWVSIAVSRYLRWLPYIVVTMALSTLLSAPFSPVAGVILGLVKDIDLVALGTPVLALVGLSLGRDTKLLLASGWKLVVVAVTVIAASFVCATAVAELSLSFLSF
ncbi:DUF3100 domain-containing protein [Actinocatenispora rupis]|uniref:DUF3100 domain-containing protein n=1 Tax=Actinocatenispora rupis TaxID=519421 RepID=A0A8J3JDP9_9ACTN|nr:DUF3100 domain-containing protein [Actinocatenispora rupis]GID12903.1 hypothetical protein Aru02nite_37920 [Actinocatenispora rupis]